MAAALTTLADVRAQLSNDASVNDHNDLLTLLIERATGAVHRYTGCEFVSAAHAEQDPEEDVTRRFLYDGGRYLRLRPFDAKSITGVVVGPDDDEPLTLEATAWRALPFSSRDGEIHTLELLAGSDLVCSSTPERVVAVTGRWGWPQVPAEVKQACEAIVIHWYRVHALTQQSYQVDADRYGPVAFPTMARMLLEPFRMRRGL